MEQQIMKLLPNVSFLGKKLTRMIVGDNPQTGHSYIEDRVTGEEMKTFYTAEKILETPFTIQDAGYNAILPLSNPGNLQVLREFRRLGGKAGNHFSTIYSRILGGKFSQDVGTGTLRHLSSGHNHRLSV